MIHQEKGKKRMSNRDKLKILFLCTGNSCRSQMAEAWAKHLKSDLIESYSAGTSPHGLNPLTVKCMLEVGIDIAHFKSKHIDSLITSEFDYVITVCDSAHESCPIFTGKTKILHVGFEDPPKLAMNASNEKEALTYYSRVRDEIRKFIESLPHSLNT